MKHNDCVNVTGFPLALQTGPLRWRYAYSLQGDV